MAVAKLELNIGGTWTDITSPDTRAAGAVSITRGRADEQSQVPYGRLGVRLASPGGKYVNRHPLSPYFGRLGRNTPIRAGVDPMSDTFTRSVTDNWGTATSGHAWTVVNGTAANFDVNGSAGTILTNSTTNQIAVLPNSYGDVDVVAKFKLVTITGLPEWSVVTRWVDLNNYYRFTVDLAVASNALVINKISNGVLVQTFNGQIASVAGIVADTWYWMRVSHGPRLRLRVWQDGAAEPTAWDMDEWDADMSGPQAGKVGLRARDGTADTITWDDLSVISYRGHFEFSESPLRQADNGDDVTVGVQASGVLRRLGRGQTALPSPLYREATRADRLQYAYAYWPCEDGTGATQIASGLAGGTPAIVTGDGYSLASYTGIPGSKALPAAGTYVFIQGDVPATMPAALAYARAVYSVPVAGITDNTNIMHLYVAGGNIKRFTVKYGAGGFLHLEAWNAANTLVDTTGGVSFAVNGKRFYLSVEVVQSGGNVSALMAVNSIAAGDQSVSSLVFTDTLNGVTIGRVRQMAAGITADGAVGHFGVGSDQSFMFSMAQALIANSGEMAATRIARIGAEAGIPIQIIGDLNAGGSEIMGPQQEGTALQACRSCEATDGGILYETRNELGLSYRTRSSMQNQAGPTISHQAGQVDTLEPTEDDQFLVNDITVSRIGGSSVRMTADTGPLSTQAPPNGVGQYPMVLSAVEVQRDSQLSDIAGWQLGLGTWDEQRFSQVGAKMFAPAVAADPNLIAQLAALDSGDLLMVSDPPTWLPPDAIGLLVQGYTETIGDGGPQLWSIDWNATPAGPYNVARYDVDRYEADTLKLAAAVTSAATSWPVIVEPPATKDATDFPSGIDLLFGGEKITATAIADSVTDTFTRSASNGWGTADSGQAWTVVGTAADFSVTSPTGRIATTTVNQLYLATVDTLSTDQRVSCAIVLPVLPTGAPFTLRMLARYTDANNFYNASLSIATSGVATLSLSKNVAGVGTVINAGVIVGTHAAGNQWTIVLDVTGPVVRTRAWNATTSADADNWIVAATDTSLATGSRAGTGVRRETGNTNGTQTVTFDNFAGLKPQTFTVTRSVNGVVKAQTAGTPGRLFRPPLYGR